MLYISIRIIRKGLHDMSRKVSFFPYILYILYRSIENQHFNHVENFEEACRELDFSTL